jgi:hypothetical protein
LAFVTKQRFLPPFLRPRRRLNVSIQRAVLHRQAERAAPRAKRAAVEIGFANECFVHTDKV